MRVPWFGVVPAILLVIGGTWWTNTRHLDFLTPPSEQRLTLLREQTRSSLSILEPPAPPPLSEEAPPAPPEPPKPQLDAADLSRTIELNAYADRAGQGGPKMVEIAQALEDHGEFQRALLAWERLVDTTKADAVFSEVAISSIRRLRPTLPDWNAAPVTIVLRANTGKKFAPTLQPAVETAAKELEKASSGVLKVKTEIVPSKTNSTAKAATPVALSLAGVEKKSQSTDTVSFPVTNGDALDQAVLKHVFVLMRGHLANHTSFNSPDELAEGENPVDALSFRITRLCWNDVATALNLPPKPAPAKTPPAKTPPAKTTPSKKKP